MPMSWEREEAVLHLVADRRTQAPNRRCLLNLPNFVDGDGHGTVATLRVQHCIREHYYAAGKKFDWLTRL